MRLVRLLLALAGACLLALAAGCGDGGGPALRPPASAASDRAPAPVLPPDAPAPRRVALALPLAGGMGAAWREAMHLPYGNATEQLGAVEYAGGVLGPMHAAPDRDGAWWVLDTHKRRIARYGAGGGFLGAVRTPDGALGTQFPFVLDGGWLVSLGPGAGLLADASSAALVPLPPGEELRLWSYSDWTSVYAVDGGTVRTASIDRAVVWGRAEALRTPDGRDFLLWVDPDDRRLLQVWLPDASGGPVRLELAFTAVEPDGQRIAAGYEVAADGAGRIHLLLYGGVEGAERLAGYTWIEPDGTVAPVEPVRDPFGPSDPGSLAHLRTVPGTSAAALTFVDPDGLRAFVRSHDGEG